jgi:pSer/pThr/pTyr-binding forkhead associated (FHA) protein
MIERPFREFREACGAKFPLELGVETAGSSSPDARLFDQPFLVVGRDSGADLTLRHPEVGRRHAYFQVVAGRLFCVDLLSRTGTYWNEVRDILGWVDSAHGVRIGPYRVRGDVGADMSLQKESGDDPLPTSRSFAQETLVDATLDYVDPRTNESINWKVSRALVLIGSSIACKIRLTKPGVASIHGSLVQTPTGLWVVDVLGLGGIVVNGRQLRCGRLVDGDELQVGPHRIRVRFGRSVTNPSVSSNLPAPRPARSDSGFLATSVSASTPMPITPPRPDTGALAPARQDAWSLTPQGNTQESLMRTMLSEIGQMQQQTAEQFQHALMFMFRSFTDMHHEQMSLIREELARIRELTEEQKSLQAELATRPPASPNPPVLRIVSGETPRIPFGPRESAAASLSLDRPSVAPSKPAELSETPAMDAKATVMDAKATVMDAKATVSESSDAMDLHRQLAQRLAALHNEQQGRWRKLLDTMLGRGA